MIYIYLYMGKLRILLLITLGMAAIKMLYSQNDECSIRNRAFGSGEKITYTVSYNWFIIWTEVGEVTFKVNETTIFNNPCLHLSGTGSTYSSWDWFFKVRDRYDSWVNPVTLKPYFFIRDVDEGGYKFRYKYIFNRNRKYALSSYTRPDKPERIDTIDITECTFDMVSISYFSRNIDYGRYRPGDTIAVTILLDNILENIYFRYQGIENLKIRRFGEFECIKFSIFLVAGSVFKGGEYMSLWVTNDKNHIPLYIESPIIVGSIKARINSIEGNKYALTSRIR